MKNQVMRCASIFLAVILASLTWASTARGATGEHSLSPSGSDDNPGTAAAPWRTFDYALEQLEPGDILTVRGGIYVEAEVRPALTPGTASAPITVRAYPGERPVIKGLVRLTDADYWHLDGINVTWGAGKASDHMVKMTDGRGWSWINSEFWGARSYALMLVASSGGSEPTGWRLAHNYLHDVASSNDKNQNHHIYCNSGPEGDGVIEGNLMVNAPNGGGVKLGGPSPDKGGASNITVRYNTIVNTAQNILLSWRASGNLLERNIFARASGPHIRGFQLTGTGNGARSNWGTDPGGMFLNDDGYQAVADLGGNRDGLDPHLDFRYHPTLDAAKGYGHAALSGGSMPDPFMFASDIARLAEAGITRVSPDDFRPEDLVTRGEMAAFLDRALGLGPASRDYFGDDEASIFEGEINRLAEARITLGANPPANDRFLPEHSVTRAEMASFLARALKLDGEAPDRFVDDEGSRHETEINRIAAEDITRGTSKTTFSPNEPVTRGQMAAFLVRGWIDRDSNS